MSNTAMYETKAYAMMENGGEWKTITIKRNALGPDDVEFDIKYCGICHSDVHAAQNEFAPFLNTKYPIVPGHELAGIATKVGKNVKNIKIGDKIGVGCLVDACLDCKACEGGCEQYCPSHTGTYNADLKHGRVSTDLGYTCGGYSGKLTIHKRFLIRIPDEYPLEKAGPVFCAGITTYSPLANWGAKQGGKRVGVVGIGGLGQMAIRQAKAMGNEVTAISTSPHKEAKAKEIGANTFVVSTSPESMAAATGSLDLILNTVSADHDATAYLQLLDVSGALVMLGAVKQPQTLGLFPLLVYRKQIAGSIIGGIEETQECIDFCNKHKIYPETELIQKEKIPEVYKKLSGKNDSIVRYVLDITKSLGTENSPMAA